MSHEALQALYALDVAEVGEKEAAKRWEYWSGECWRYNERFHKIIVKPSWCEDIIYRRKPGIPWPKAMQLNQLNDEPEIRWCYRKDGKAHIAGTPTQEDALKYLAKRNSPTTQWPADAPEWANYMATDLDGTTVFYSDKPKPLEHWWERGGTMEHNGSSCPNWRDTLIERPKPVLKKIDWSKLRDIIKRDYWVFDDNCFPSPWIAWNCDEHTRGNPLPDGLVVDWFGMMRNTINIHPVCWDTVTRFRIAGIQEGWE